MTETYQGSEQYGGRQQSQRWRKSGMERNDEQAACWLVRALALPRRLGTHASNRGKEVGKRGTGTWLLNMGWDGDCIVMQTFYRRIETCYLRGPTG